MSFLCSSVNSKFLFHIKLIYWDLPNRQTTICFTNFNIKLNLIALIKTRIINHSALHYHQVPKKCPTSPPTILPVFMRLRRLFILFILKSHFFHSKTTTPVCPLVHYGKKRREWYFNHSLCNEPTGVRTRDT